MKLACCIDVIDHLYLFSLMCDDQFVNFIQIVQVVFQILGFFEKLNCKCKIWAERSVVLDEVDPAIRANLESRGWLPLLEVDHPPSTAIIREFFSNLSCHIYDSKG